MVRLLELRRGSASWPSFAALRRPREGVPFAGVHVQVDLASDDLEDAVREDQGGVAAVVRGGGASAPRYVDSLPTGGLPVQEYGGGAADFAGVTSRVMKTMPELKRDLSVISLFLGLFCKILGRM